MGYATGMYLGYVQRFPMLNLCKIMISGCREHYKMEEA